MKVIERPSPNHDDRRGLTVSMLVIHYTGMETAEAALARLTDPAAKVSAHYTIDEDGTVYAHVPEDRRAWHAGVSVWRGMTDVNAASIGIELVNPGHAFGYRPFAQAQMEALTELARRIVGRHPIPARNIVGHSDVAPARKLDPGELLDWKRLAAAGVGVWPAGQAGAEDYAPLGPGASGEAVRLYQARLADWGYGLAATGSFDAETEAVTIAFQRHFRPERVTGHADAETQGRLAALLAQVRAQA
ncbi:peptidoglycan recognition protein family protein [Pedomonas mirosovicensis]|uniref:peptidoglycan recognition protein family protein n=1 Tax=Pedomonas mirosovicensis TaxID=2908641 RepID=UPI002168B3F5|nr:N-acetylmuramoyl-L-alanine amidase [Pedomonas mirosovicensis]MCH8684659.1 N-acetylmuramoyl-L-alanine amidase [Pedomonas mirosovicensis]